MNINGCLLTQYADDAQILQADTIDNLNDLISSTEAALPTIKLPFLTNGLLLNPPITQCIFIGNRQVLSHIPLDTFISCDSVHNIYPSTHVKKMRSLF